MSDTTNTPPEDTPSFDPAVSGAPLVDWASAVNDIMEDPAVEKPAEEDKITRMTPTKEGEDLVAAAIATLRGLELEPDTNPPPPLGATYVLPAVGGIKITAATATDGGIVLCFDFDGNPRFICRQSAPMARQFLTLLAAAVTQSRVFAGVQS